MTRMVLLTVLTLLAAASAAAAPPLVVIEDTLYRADGSRFAGTAEISWPTFQALDNSHIASHTLTVRIVDGALRVRLTPTAESRPAAAYTVRYQSDGRHAFAETWSVPNSTAKLRVKDVRLLRGTASTPSTPGATNVEISDVVGLSEALSTRPVRGLAYQAGRAVVTDESGALVTVDGSADDCVRADGSIGPCGTGSSLPVFVDLQTPSGTVNGVNPVFTLSSAPDPASSLHVYRNGLLQRLGVDYSLTGNTITFLAASTPQSGDILQASYRAAPAQ